MADETTFESYTRILNSHVNYIVIWPTTSTVSFAPPPKLDFSGTPLRFDFDKKNERGGLLQRISEVYVGPKIVH